MGSLKIILFNTKRRKKSFKLMMRILLSTNLKTKTFLNDLFATLLKIIFLCLFLKKIFFFLSLCPLFFVCNSFFLKTSLIANQFYPTCFAIHFSPVRFCMVMAPNHRSIEMTFVFCVLCFVLFHFQF